MVLFSIYCRRKNAAIYNQKYTGERTEVMAPM